MGQRLAMTWVFLMAPQIVPHIPVPRAGPRPAERPRPVSPDLDPRLRGGRGGGRGASSSFDRLRMRMNDGSARHFIFEIVSEKFLKKSSSAYALFFS